MLTVSIRPRVHHSGELTIGSAWQPDLQFQSAPEFITRGNLLTISNPVIAEVFQSAPEFITRGNDLAYVTSEVNQLFQSAPEFITRGNTVVG